jgi:hypothetical protein
MTGKPWTPPAIPPRRPGWERAYVEILERHMALPFSWRQHCLTVPADLCLGMTGVDPMRGLRRCSTEAGAMKLLFKLGFSDVEGALAAVFPPVPLLMARRGDCGVFDHLVDGKRALATVIIMGDRAVGKGPGGQVSVPTHRLKSAFAIGAR